MRKAVSLMATVVRSAYVRKMEMPEDKPERKSPLLIIQRQDCQAFFGNCKEDVAELVPTLFGASRFVSAGCFLFSERSANSRFHRFYAKRGAHALPTTATAIAVESVRTWRRLHHLLLFLASGRKAQLFPQTTKIYFSAEHSSCVCATLHRASHTRGLPLQLHSRKVDKRRRLPRRCRKLTPMTYRWDTAVAAVEQ